MNTFVDSEPVKGLEDRRDVRIFKNFNHSTLRRVLGRLEEICLRLRKISIHKCPQ